MRGHVRFISPILELVTENRETVGVDLVRLAPFGINVEFQFQHDLSARRHAPANSTRVASGKPAKQLVGSTSRHVSGLQHFAGSRAQEPVVVRFGSQGPGGIRHGIS